MLKEKWVPIKGYEGLYEISNHGRLRGLAKLGGHHNIKEGGILSPSISRGYYKTRLSKDDKANTFLISRLVASHFIPNVDEKPYVNHKNGIKTDNRVDNLEWCTPKENTTHAVINGLWKPNFGAMNGRAKLVLDNEMGIYYEYAADAAKAKSINPNTLRSMLNGHDRNWTSLRYV